MADIMLLRVSEELNRKLCLKATQMRKTRSQLAAAILQEWIDSHADDAQAMTEGSGDKPQTNERRPSQCRQGNPSA